jgi:hypothetical protein
MYGVKMIELNLATKIYKYLNKNIMSEKKVYQSMFHFSWFDGKMWKMSMLGLIHSRHFYTQYCDKKILRHLTFLATDSCWTTKVSCYKTLSTTLCTLYYVLIRAYPGLLTSMAQKYLFIAISFYQNIVCKNVSCE